ncbi:MAG: hypothetical protein M0R33_17110 [Methylomonas sp.]|jgi:hypothetical protein|uniref:hypothetical protein n=1 Tax=Methylomonas sp. TaxID=418 RepID=UPI0025E43506|nr:hypothetical protein [Methylomonas sp.]MCK9608166.1 hypothetical protein [Methylomonas sp.]
MGAISPFVWQEIIGEISDYRTLWRMRAVSRDFRDIADALIAKKSRFTLDLALAKRETPCSSHYFRDVGRYCIRSDIAPQYRIYRNGANYNIFRGACDYGRTDIVDSFRNVTQQAYDPHKPVKYACKYRRIAVMRRLIRHFGFNTCMILFLPGKGVSADADAAYLAWHHATFRKHINYAAAIASYAGKTGNLALLECNACRNSSINLNHYFCESALECGHRELIKQNAAGRDCIAKCDLWTVCHSLDKELINEIGRHMSSPNNISDMMHYCLHAAIKRDNHGIIDWILTFAVEINYTFEIIFAAKKRNFIALFKILAKWSTNIVYARLTADSLRCAWARTEYFADSRINAIFSNAIADLQNADSRDDIPMEIE